jgi:outer membrane immunogenic protein
MRKLVLISALAAAFITPSVFAQAKNFEGFNIQASTGYQHNDIDVSNVTVNGLSIPGGGAQDTHKGRMALNLGAGYTFAINDRFTLGALVEWNPLKMKTGSGSLTVNGSSVAGTEYSGKLENQVSISIVPGYAFNDRTLGYLKLGWIHAKAKLEPNAANSPNFSESVDGFLMGVGAKHLFNKNVYGFAEATYASYGSVNSSRDIGGGVIVGGKMKPSSYSFLVGIGAQF